MLVRVLVIGVPFTLGAVLLTWLRMRVEARDAPIVVVDERTLRRAIRRIVKAAESGDYVRAYAGLTAASAWLEGQIATGPRRRRGEYVQIKSGIDETREAAQYVIFAHAEKELASGAVVAGNPARARPVPSRADRR
jgi:hypothetical protein